MSWQQASFRQEFGREIHVKIPKSCSSGSLQIGTLLCDLQLHQCFNQLHVWCIQGAFQCRKNPQMPQTTIDLAFICNILQYFNAKRQTPLNIPRPQSAAATFLHTLLRIERLAISEGLGTSRAAPFCSACPAELAAFAIARSEGGRRRSVAAGAVEISVCGRISTDHFFHIQHHRVEWSNSQRRDHVCRSLLLSHGFATRLHLPWQAVRSLFGRSPARISRHWSHMAHRRQIQHPQTPQRAMADLADHQGTWWDLRGFSTTSLSFVHSHENSIDL